MFQSLHRQLPCFLAVLGLVGTTTVLADIENYGPVTLDENAIERPGAIVWMDLLTHDVEAAAAFYGKALGWEFEFSPDGAYAWATSKGAPVAGIAAYDDPEAGEGLWLPSFSVPDVDAAVRTIEMGTGQVIDPPETLPGRGRYLLAEDPLGAPFILLRSEVGDPKPAQVPGRWFWHELWTSDVDRSTEFYEALLGYRTVLIKDEGGYEHNVMGRDKSPSASVLTSPLPGVEPSWLGYLLVDDIDDAVEAVVDAGGVVYVPPVEGTITESMAIVGDPTGGVFGMQEED